MTPTDTQVGDQWALGSSPDGDTHRAPDGAVLGRTPLDSTVSVESIGKIIRRHMQDHSIPAKVRSERAASEVAARFGLALLQAAQTDPMERLTGDALRGAGIAFITDHEPESPARLDFYLPSEDLHIEVKRFHSDRVTEQLTRAENVVLLQGKGAVRFFAGIVAGLPPPAASVSPGTKGEARSDPKPSQHPIRREGEPVWAIGSWLSAALDDPKVCAEMKRDINEWFDGGGYRRAHPPTSYGKGEDNEPSNITCQFDAGQPVSNPYKFTAEIEWLREAARYFAKRPTGGEDSAHWANVYNAENATKLATRLQALQSIGGRTE